MLKVTGPIIEPWAVLYKYFAIDFYDFPVLPIAICSNNNQTLAHRL